MISNHTLRDLSNSAAPSSSLPPPPPPCHQVFCGYEWVTVWKKAQHACFKMYWVDKEGYITGRSEAEVSISLAYVWMRIDPAVTAETGSCKMRDIGEAESNELEKGSLPPFCSLDIVTVTLAVSNSVTLGVSSPCFLFPLVGPDFERWWIPAIWVGPLTNFFCI